MKPPRVEPPEPRGGDETAPAARPGAPLALKIALSVQGFFYFAVSGLTTSKGGDAAVRAAVLAASAIALVAVWTLRRWGLYVMAAVLAFYLATHLAFPPIAWRGVILGAAVRSIGIASGIACWRRLA